MLGQSKLVHGPHTRIDDAKDEIQTEPLAHYACAKTTGRIRISKVRVAAFIQLRLLQTREKTGRELVYLIGRESRRLRPNRLKTSVQSPTGSHIYAEMNVGRAGGLSDRQIFIDVGQRMRLPSVAPGDCGHDAEIIRSGQPRKLKSSHQFFLEDLPLA